jgi:hypothetical protein
VNAVKGKAMTASHLRLAALAAGIALHLAAPAAAQTTMAPLSSPIAPGPDSPPYGLGGLGPSNVPIAPGAAMTGDTDIERIGPGGTLLAPGPAGGLGGSQLGTPALPSRRVR